MPAPGPRDLTAAELERHGLGVIVRQLPGGGASAGELRRVYCLGCGISIDHDPPAQRWWICVNGCNVTDVEGRALGLRVLEDPLVADIRRLDRVASRLKTPVVPIPAV